MDIQRVNSVIERAILNLQVEETEALFEFSVPTPAAVAKRTGMKLPRKPRAKKAPDAVSVAFWIMYLNHKLTRWDMQMSARERSPNIYRMGHLLNASRLVEKKVFGIQGESDHKSIERFRKAMKSEFEKGFPPIVAVDKAIDKYWTSGKRPKIGK